MAIVQIAARFIDIPPFTPGIIAMIGTGAGIDYALFILTRFREEKQQGRTEADTVAKAISGKDQFRGGRAPRARPFSRLREWQQRSSRPFPGRRWRRSQRSSLHSL